jgi:hypothetical protein
MPPKSKKNPNKSKLVLEKAIPKVALDLGHTKNPADDETNIVAMLDSDSRRSSSSVSTMDTRKRPSSTFGGSARKRSRQLELESFFSKMSSSLDKFTEVFAQSENQSFHPLPQRS